ncbi:MAG: hypothetical protein UT16_C0026G0004 [Candidatus Azambacteria bacterium GW2011_GWA2_39_10]|uniref:Uncharacterized protein n=1 Tax=Candidatus Azambacteria bacterium GW2011_GWA2_39_10 TaxID=1618611 RepID=A0A0G0LJA5_9BACT|nr:MAG: hypothetical protein UT16_C0026G0004 [Candidatus Azambacteria bacterium GW2011_GWA2_39_10]
MKNQKLKIKNFTFYFIFTIFCLLFAVSVMAQVKLETGLPGIPSSGLPVGQELPSYINYLFIFSLGLVTILALTQMIIGGITYILAAGNAAKVEDAKDMILQALLGVGILLISYLLLRTINPDLVNLRNPTLIPTSFIPAPTPTMPTGPEVPPIPGIPSELIYNVTSPQACAGAGGQAFSPCQTFAAEQNLKKTWLKEIFT